MKVPFAPAETGRERIRREHAELRLRLEEIQHLLARWEAGAEAAGVALRDHGLALYERLGNHIDVEETILAHALRASEAEAGHAQRFAAEHEEQRELLGFLRTRMSALRPTLLVVRELRSFIAYLREDMVREEGVLDALEDAG